MTNPTISAEELARQAWLVWRGVAGPAKTEGEFRGLITGVARQAEQAAYERGLKAGGRTFAHEMADEFERQAFPDLARKIRALAQEPEEVG